MLFKTQHKVLTVLFVLILLSLIITWTSVEHGQVRFKVPLWSPFSSIRNIVSTPSERFYFPMHPPPTSLINLKNFQYLLNPNVCGTDQVFMVIVVGSHLYNVVMRNAIRLNWRNATVDGRPIKLVFAFGQVESPAMQMELTAESSIYRDIIQGNFEDSYMNMSYRDMMGLRWAWQYCGQAKYVLRADDDISIDIFQLSTVLLRDFNDGKDFVGCFMVMAGMPVLRTGKYGVSEQDHPESSYEPYCSGWMYVMTSRMAYLLDVTSVRVQYFWMNDAFITGRVLAGLKMEPQDLKIPSTMDDKVMIGVEQQNDTLPIKIVVGYVGLNATLMFNLHQKYERAFYRNNTLGNLNYGLTKGP